MRVNNKLKEVIQGIQLKLAMFYHGVFKQCNTKNQNHIAKNSA